MGYGLLRAFPGETGLACHRLRNTQLRLTRGHRPLGRQDHTTSPSASHAFVDCALGVHRISHRVRDDREAPLDRVRRANHTLSCHSDKPKYFHARGLTGFAELPVGLFCRTSFRHFGQARRAAPRRSERIRYRGGSSPNGGRPLQWVVRSQHGDCFAAASHSPTQRLTKR